MLQRTFSLFFLLLIFSCSKVEREAYRTLEQVLIDYPVLSSSEVDRLAKTLSHSHSSSPSDVRKKAEDIVDQSLKNLQQLKILTYKSFADLDANLMHEANQAYLAWYDYVTRFPLNLSRINLTREIALLQEDFDQKLLALKQASKQAIGEGNAQRPDQVYAFRSPEVAALTENENPRDSRNRIRRDLAQDLRQSRFSKQNYARVKKQDQEKLRILDDLVYEEKHTVYKEIPFAYEGSELTRFLSTDFIDKSVEFYKRQSHPTHATFTYDIDFFKSSRERSIKDWNYQDSDAFITKLGTLGAEVAAAEYDELLKDDMLWGATSLSQGTGAQDEPFLLAEDFDITDTELARMLLNAQDKQDSEEILTALLDPEQSFPDTTEDADPIQELATLLQESTPIDSPADTPPLDQSQAIIPAPTITLRKQNDRPADEDIASDKAESPQLADQLSPKVPDVTPNFDTLKTKRAVPPAAASDDVKTTIQDEEEKSDLNQPYTTIPEYNQADPFGSDQAEGYDDRLEGNNFSPIPSESEKRSDLTPLFPSNETQHAPVDPIRPNYFDNTIDEQQSLHDESTQVVGKQAQAEYDLPTSLAGSQQPGRDWSRIFFGFDGTELNDSAKHFLKVLVDRFNLLNQAENSYLVVSGFADRSGPQGYNYILSQQRAETVRQHLNSLGVPNDKIVLLAFGENRSLIKTKDHVSNPNNRRVDVIIGTKNIHAGT